MCDSFAYSQNVEEERKKEKKKIKYINGRSNAVDFQVKIQTQVRE